MKKTKSAAQVATQEKSKLDYPYIRAWERMMGAFPYYIEIQLNKARADKAPHDAIYKQRDGGGWATFGEIKREDTKQQVAELVKRYQ